MKMMFGLFAGRFAARRSQRDESDINCNHDITYLISSIFSIISSITSYEARGPHCPFGSASCGTVSPMGYADSVSQHRWQLGALPVFAEIRLFFGVGSQSELRHTQITDQLHRLSQPRDVHDKRFCRGLAAAPAITPARLSPSLLPGQTPPTRQAWGNYRASKRRRRALKPREGRAAIERVKRRVTADSSDVRSLLDAV
jgi:hypothetical protein